MVANAGGCAQSVTEFLAEHSLRIPGMQASSAKSPSVRSILRRTNAESEHFVHSSTARKPRVSSSLDRGANDAGSFGYHHNDGKEGTKHVRFSDDVLNTAAGKKPEFVGLRLWMLTDILLPKVRPV